MRYMKYIIVLLLIIFNVSVYADPVLPKELSLAVKTGISHSRCYAYTLDSSVQQAHLTKAVTAFRFFINNIDNTQYIGKWRLDVSPEFTTLIRTKLTYWPPSVDFAVGVLFERFKNQADEELSEIIVEKILLSNNFSLDTIEFTKTVYNKSNCFILLKTELFN